MNLDFWKGKRVFLTGHTGFKGSWLALWLQKMGAELTGYALLPPTNPSMFDFADVGYGMKSIIADIRDFDTLQKSIQDSSPEVLIHMAAQPLVRFSYDDPIETYTTNVMGTVNVLEAVRKSAGVKSVIIVTSDKCYENKEWLWGYRENEPMGGHDPYSNSKGCAELVSAAYRSSYFNATNYQQHGTAVATVRAGNVIGGGDWASDRLVPDIINSFKNKQLASIRNPNSIRPWQFVLEPLRGYLMLAEKLYIEGTPFAEAWNFGPVEDDVKPVSWISDTLSKLWGNEANWKSDSISQVHEANYLKLDSSKANHRLGWKQSTRLNTALQSIVKWHKALIAGADMRKETLEQILNYEQTLNQGGE